MSTSLAIRRATPDDAEEITRLRGVMFESMGITAEPGEWTRHCEGVLRDRLADGTFAGFVVDHPDERSRLVACGVVMTSQRIPSPGHLDGRHAYIQNMATEEAFRGRGLARSIFEALRSWIADNGIRAAELHASPMGEPLYRSYGWRENATPELVWREWETGHEGECA